MTAALTGDPLFEEHPLDDLAALLTEPLTDERAREFARRRDTGDRKARNQLAAGVARLAKKQVREANPNGDGPEHEARAALACLEAADRWNPDHPSQAKFSTYAYNRIRDDLKKERSILYRDSEALSLDETYENAEGEERSLHDVVADVVDDEWDDSEPADVATLYARQLERHTRKAAISRYLDYCQRVRKCRCGCKRSTAGAGPRARYAGSTDREREEHRGRFRRWKDKVLNAPSSSWRRRTASDMPLSLPEEIERLERYLEMKGIVASKCECDRRPHRNADRITGQQERRPALPAYGFVFVDGEPVPACPICEKLLPAKRREALELLVRRERIRPPDKATKAEIEERRLIHQLMVRNGARKRDKQRVAP
jgi:hypothetical protein